MRWADSLDNPMDKEQFKQLALKYKVFEFHVLNLILV